MRRHGLARTVVISGTGLALWVAPAPAAAQLSFQAAPDVSMPRIPEALAGGDFDGDGHVDLVAATGSESERATVRLGLGTGAFTAAPEVIVGSVPIDAVTADFNGDGRLDFATANFIGDSVSVRLGNGDGTFALTATVAVGARPRGIAAGDVTGDGTADLLTADRDADAVSVLSGRGDGSFTAAAPVPVKPSPHELAVADLDGDGDLDVVTSNGSVRLNAGNGTFTAASDVPVGSSIGVTIADLDGDGNPDLIVPDGTTNLVAILLGEGDGTFASAPDVPATNPVFVAAGDLDGDDRADLAIAENFVDRVAVRRGDGAGGFGPPLGLAVTRPDDIVMADIDEDGRPDLAIAQQTSGGGVAIRLNRAGSSPYAAAVLADGPAAYWRLGALRGPTALDASGHGNHGVLRNGVRLGVAGALVGDADTAAAFDGVDDHVRVPDSPSLDVGDRFTLEGWIKRATTRRSHQLFNKGGGGLQLVVLSAADGNRVALRKAGDSTIARSFGGVPADGRFHHVVVTRDGPRSTRMYIDGVAQTVQQVTGDAIQDTTRPLFFSSTTRNAAVAGALDELAVYGRVLSASEVAKHHRTGTGGG